MVQKRILIVDDERNILSSLKGMLEDEHFLVQTASSGAAALAVLKEFLPDVVLLDIWMPGEDGLAILEKIKTTHPDLQVIMMSGHGTIETAVQAIKKGSFDFLEKPLHFDKLLVLLEHAFALKELQDENRNLRQALHDEEPIIGSSPRIQQLRHLISLAGPSSGWALIQGENGTGKELVARALHRSSGRAGERFVAVNCAAIPDELIESELFGHEKGSFTGAADRKIGKFEQAHRGTLFLDEVGDMGPKMQAKILRALQECAIQRVGGHEVIDLDLRVIAATNRNLEEEIGRGNFREDLFYRLNVIPVPVPSLRERPGDVLPLAEHFLKRYSPGRRRSLSESVQVKMQSYSWPGNVRELKNWIERVCILSGEEAIDHFDILRSSEWGESESSLSLREARAKFERNFILSMLDRCEGNVSKTAQVIGVERSHLHKKMKAFGIEWSNPV